MFFGSSYLEKNKQRLLLLALLKSSSSNQEKDKSIYFFKFMRLLLLRLFLPLHAVGSSFCLFPHILLRTQLIIF